GKDWLEPFWLWLERIGVERRDVVSNLQFVQPIQLAQHERRSEACGPPLGEIAVDPRGPLPKPASGPVESSVVLKIVDAHFEAIAHEFFSQVPGGRISSLRNKIE